MRLGPFPCAGVVWLGGHRRRIRGSAGNVITFSEHEKVAVGGNRMASHCEQDGRREGDMEIPFVPAALVVGALPHRRDQFAPSLEPGGCAGPEPSHE